MGIVDGKIAIVTGAGRGVGRGEAMELAAQGAKVVVCDPGPSTKGEGNDKRPAEETVSIITERGGEAVADHSDISTWQGGADVVQHAIDVYGGLDILVNNAGILRDALIPRMTEEEWDSVIAVHLKGTMATTHHACAYWYQESKEGRQRRAAIVNTVSSAGLQGNIGQANYGAAKAGIAAPTTITAVEGARYGVRANAVAPGGATRMVNESMPSIAVREADELGDEDPFERLNPGNSAPMVVRLASDESTLVSGQVFRAVGHEIADYLPWHLGPSAENLVKGEPQKWDPARIGDALAKDVFGLRPGGLNLRG